MSSIDGLHVRASSCTAQCDLSYRKTEKSICICIVLAASSALHKHYY